MPKYTIPRGADLVGMTFGRLTVVRFLRSGHDRIWLCRCQCGNEREAPTGILKSGDLASCGCIHRDRVTLDNFWKNVTKTERCWIWSGTLDKDGYGQLTYDSRIWKAHRLAWTIGHGEIPKGLHVLHHCDNPPCVNYESCLFLGTNHKNILDRLNKERGLKITNAIVDDIRRRVAAGGRGTRAALAREYNLDESYVGDISNGKSWMHRPFPKD